MQCYVAYGLRIVSSISLPELIPGVGPEADSGDVVVRFGIVRPQPTNLDESGFGFWATEYAACHLVDKVGAFLVSGGREIVVEPAPDVDERLLRLSLLGPALGLLLHQRGLLVLHASVVSWRGVAVAFLGQHGWGKSTIAAALHAKGYDLVTDDVAAIQLGPDGPTVLPSFPQMKLWPESARLVGEAPEHLPILHPRFDKRGWRAARGFSAAPCRLQRLYVIAAGPAPAIEPLQPQEGCFQLLSHWYGHRFGAELLRSSSAAQHLRQTAELANRAPMYRLCRSGGPATLVELADLVDRQLRRETDDAVPASSGGVPLG
jgi:hypothetical protein